MDIARKRADDISSNEEEIKMTVKSRRIKKTGTSNLKEGSSSDEEQISKLADPPIFVVKKKSWCNETISQSIADLDLPILQEKDLEESELLTWKDVHVLATGSSISGMFNGNVENNQIVSKNIVTNPEIAFVTWVRKKKHYLNVSQISEVAFKLYIYYRLYACIHYLLLNIYII